MESFWLAIFYYSIAYTTVTIIGVGHAAFNIYVSDYKSMKESLGMGEAYEKTKSVHLSINTNHKIRRLYVY